MKQYLYALLVVSAFVLPLSAANAGDKPIAAKDLPPTVTNISAVTQASTPNEPTMAKDRIKPEIAIDDALNAPVVKKEEILNPVEDKKKIADETQSEFDKSLHSNKKPEKYNKKTNKKYNSNKKLNNTPAKQN